MKYGKRLLALLLVLVLTVSLAPGVAAEEEEELTENGFTYTVADGEATVTNGPDIEHVVIPDTLGGYPVTALANASFQAHTNIVSVQIPETVRSLGRYCFYESENLTTVNFPEALEFVDTCCFYRTNLQIDTLEVKFFEMGNQAFIGASIRKLILPEGMTNVPFAAFNSCGIEELSLPSTLQIIGDNAFSENPLGSVTIPEGVTVLSGASFSRCQLESINLPSTLKELGDFALAENPLSELQLPEGLELLGWKVFSNCPNLKTIRVPASVVPKDGCLKESSIEEVIGDKHSPMALYCQKEGYPFRDEATGELIPPAYTKIIDNICYLVYMDHATVASCISDVSPKELTIPQTIDERPVTEIMDEAFLMGPVEWVVIPEGVTRIGKRAFSGCENLYYVGLPSTIAYIGDEAFYECPSLKSIYFPETATIRPAGEDLAGKGIFGWVIILGHAGSPVEEFFRNSWCFLPMEEGIRYFQYGNGVYATTDGKTARLEKFLVEYTDHTYWVPNTVAGIPVTEITPLAFNGLGTYHLVVGYNVTTICQNAFFLKSPDEIFIPENVISIDDGAFPSDADPSIVGFAGTYAEEFAGSHGYTFYTTEKMPFTDVKESAWYYDEVLYVYRNGLMRGVSDTKFQPEGTTSRAMLVQVLFNMAGDPGFSGEYGFRDVSGTAWYAQAVNWAACNGIVNGMTQSKFAPNDPVTREQVATILYRFAEKTGLDVSARADLLGYSDSGRISNYAQDAMAWAVGAGILQGMSATTLEPRGLSTRAQIATMLMRFVTWAESQV